MVHTISIEEDRQYIEEFRRTPIGAHSPGLQRVLNVMRLDRDGAQPILICRKPFAAYVIGSLPTDRAQPIAIEDEPVFATREQAEWALFCRRWREHTGEIIARPLHD